MVGTPRVTVSPRGARSRAEGRAKAGIGLRSLSLVAAGLLLAACSSSHKATTAQTPASSSASASSSVSAGSPTAASPTASSGASAGSGGAGVHPTISITPAGPYTDGQTVHVTGSGFSPHESLVVEECANKGTNTGPGDCDLEGLVSITSDANGNVTADYKVKKGPFGANKIVCSASQPCLLSVTQPTPNPTEEADVPLSFQ